MRGVVLVTAGNRLPPLTAEIPLALVPILDRPVAAYAMDLLRRHGAELIAFLAEGEAEGPVREWLADDLPVLTSAGQLGDLPGEGPIVLLRGDVLTDLDVAELVARAGDVDVVNLTQGPPDAAEPGFAWHELDSVDALRRATFALVAGDVDLDIEGTELEAGLFVGEGTTLDGIALIEPPVWIGAEVEIGMNARLEGPLVIGDRAAIGDGAHLRDAVIFPGSTIPRETVLAGGVAGHAAIVESLRRR
jgi:NDP-sugar pyrophosphorylase family protein